MNIRDILRQMLVQRYPSTIVANYVEQVLSLGASCGYGQFGTLTLGGNTRNNLIKSSNMNTDSNVDGVVDDWNALNTSLSAIFSLSNNSQKIAITNCAVVGTAFLRQGSFGDAYQIPCSAGDIVSVRVNCAYSKTTGSPSAYVALQFRDSSGALLATYNSYTLTATATTDLVVENKTAPANTNYVSVSCFIATSVSAPTTPESATVYFKNAVLEKAATAGSYISSGVKCTNPERVKVIGKNLFDAAPVFRPSASQNGITITNNAGTILVNGTATSIVDVYIAANASSQFCVNVEIVTAMVKAINANIVLSNNLGLQNWISFGGGGFTTNTALGKDIEGLFLRIASGATFNNAELKIQIEKGSTATAYEPYTAQEAYTPSIGNSLPNGVKDEFNVLTGELTQRVSASSVLDGSAYWTTTGTANQVDTMVFLTANFESTIAVGGAVFGINYPTLSDFDQDVEGMRNITSGTNGTRIYVRVKRSKLTTQDATGFKAYLTANPITFIYQLATAIIQQYTTRYFKDGLGASYLEACGPNTTVSQDAVATKEAVPVGGKITLSTIYPLYRLCACYKHNGGTSWTDVLSTASLNKSTGEVTITNADNTATYFVAATIDPISATLGTVKISNPVLN